MLGVESVTVLGVESVSEWKVLGVESVRSGKC